MRYRLAILLISLFIFIDCIGQDKYALVIGIGNYPEQTGWNKIHGNNDVPIITSWLNSNGFISEHIISLVDEEATYAGILQGFENLIGIVSANDIVYIHFSGHGQQITDIDGDEEDSFDESWIPYDAHKTYVAGQYEGERHITDDTLNELLSEIRKKIGAKGKLTVVSDACHSGGGSRSEDENDEDVCVRGTSDKFIIPTTSTNKTRYSRSVDWLFIGACKSYQTNFEYKYDGVFYGSLTYIITHNELDVTSDDYSKIIVKWQQTLSAISTYPQSIDSEGLPNKKSKTLF